MGWLFGFLAFSLGLVFLWGLLAPRGQWRALAAWSVADQHRHEPGGATYGLRRLISALGLLGLVVVVGVSASSALARVPGAAPTHGPLTLMWGDPAPLVVNRIVAPDAAAPPGLTEIPISGYQSYDDGDLPAYLSGLREFELLGNDDPSGYVGTYPPIGNGALDFADIVINVRGPILCIPRSVVVVQSDTEVRVGVFYGLPRAADGSEPDSLAGCPADATLTGSVLIPIDLGAALGERALLGLDGSPLSEVPVIT